MYYLTKEQRKEVFIYDGKNFKFETSVDLSDTINVYQMKKLNDCEYKKSLAEDISLFIFYFTIDVYPKLNGFSGFDTLKWNFI